MSERHRFLVMEDTPADAKELRDLLAAMDIECDLVTTLLELRAFLETGVRPCAAMLDMQVPSEPRANAHEQSGQTGIGLVQAKWKDEARVPILVVTAFRSDPEYVWLFSERKVDEFCAKASIALLPGKIGSALRKVGCEEHAACVEIARKLSLSASPGAAVEGKGKARSVAAPEAAVDGSEEKARVILAMVGAPVGRGKTSVRICGETRAMLDVAFAALLRAVDAHDRQPGEWFDRFDLGFGLDRKRTTLIRAPFKGLVPEGFEAFQGNQRRQFRLNPEVVVETVDWASLATHPDPAICAIAEKAMKKRAR